MFADVQRALHERPADTRLLFLCDYDGTLADFHPDPTIPLPSPETAELLRRIAQREDLTFGIVSGRRIADLRTRTQLSPRVYLAGLHGLEIEVGSKRWQHPDLDAARRHVRSLYERLSDLPDRIPGLLIEDKHASIAIHVRAVPADRQWRALQDADARAAAWVSAGKVRRLPGHCVIEFLPNIAAHKGDATRWIARDVEAKSKQRVWVVFVGDDLTDEDAFGAITRGIGVLVGDRETRATHQIADTRDVCRLLRWVVHDAREVAV
jgi:trehalose 6-phosphate phosphatase